MCAHRRVLFHKIDPIFMKKRGLRESKLDLLGSLSESSNLEVKKIKCHPVDPKVLASLIGNNVQIWDLDKPNQQTQTLSLNKPVNSLAWRHS